MKRQQPVKLHYSFQRTVTCIILFDLLNLLSWEVILSLVPNVYGEIGSERLSKLLISHSKYQLISGLDFKAYGSRFHVLSLKPVLSNRTFCDDGKPVTSHLWLLNTGDVTIAEFFILL